MGCRDRSLTFSPSYEYKKMNLLIFLTISFREKELTLILGILTSSAAGASAGGASAGGASTAASSDIARN